MRQAMKGIWWMPWRQEAMKDVEACDKPRLVGKQAVSRDVRMGKPNQLRWLPYTEYIGVWKLTRGTETSQYPEEKKSTEIP